MRTRQNPTYASASFAPRQKYCTGSLTLSYVTGCEVWLTDARGQATPRVRNFFYCSVH